VRLSSVVELCSIDTYKFRVVWQVQKRIERQVKATDVNDPFHTVEILVDNVTKS